MAENIFVKAKITGMQMADPITEEGQLDSVTWEDLPLTLRDDVIEISEEEPQEEEIFSHENDTAEEYEVSGGGLRVKGSFIRLNYDDLVKLVGGQKVNDRFHHSSSKLMLNKALRFNFKTGKEIIIPNAKGYVQTNLAVGYGGTSKFPFNFRCKKASETWDCDIIW